MEEQTKYEQNLNELWATSSDLIFSNSHPSHARMILVSFLERAKKTVNIFCYEASEEVYGDESFRNALKEATARGVKVKLIYQAEQLKTNLDEFVGDNFEIRKAVKEYIRDLSLNFSTADSRALRLEKDKSRCNAIACVNTPKEASKLDNFFSESWAVSQ